MTIYRLLSATMVLLISGACAPPAVDHEADLQNLRDAAAKYHAAASAKAADQVFALYGEGALMVPPAGDLVEGLAAVENYRFGFIVTAGVELQFDLIRAEVSDSGDMGWTLALGDITINRPEGPPGKDLVRDFHVWEKQADGSWKVVVDMWNSGPIAP